MDIVKENYPLENVLRTFYSARKMGHLHNEKEEKKKRLLVRPMKH